MLSVAMVGALLAVVVVGILLSDSISNLSSPQQPSIQVRDPNPIYLPPEAAGITVKRLAYSPIHVTTIEDFCPPPRPCRRIETTFLYSIRYDVNLSRVRAILWIAIDGAGKSFNHTHHELRPEQQYVQDFKVLPENYEKEHYKKYAYWENLFGEEGKVDLWQGGEQVQVRFGFLTREDNPRLAITEETTIVLKCGRLEGADEVCGR